MATTALATVAAFQQEGSFEDNESVFNIVVRIVFLLMLSWVVWFLVHLIVKSKSTGADAGCEAVDGIT